MRGLGRRWSTTCSSWLERVRERDVWQPVPAEVKAYFASRLR